MPRGTMHRSNHQRCAALSLQLISVVQCTLMDHSVHVRCNQCKVPCSGRKGARRHGEETGHRWQPAFECLGCHQTFNRRKQWEGHVPPLQHRAPVAPMATPSQITSNTMVEGGLDSENVHESTLMSHTGVQVRCNQCETTFSSRGAARQHGQETGHLWRPAHEYLGCHQTTNMLEQGKDHIPQEPRPSPIVPAAAIPPQIMSNAMVEGGLDSEKAQVSTAISHAFFLLANGVPVRLGNARSTLAHMRNVYICLHG
ncbi:hypothetical protein C8Q73DRAFT_220556 [Cubamyces lactineus]|nr:hypothetical protein C8Q73DRAFT_220556 [Cubamyces lactineus]